jgi:hypothetical protein
MQIRPLFYSAFDTKLGFIFLSSPPAPPHFETPAQAARGCKVHGKHGKAQGDHPEPENRKKPEQTARAENDAERNAQQPGTGQRNAEPAKRDAAHTRGGTFRFIQRF